MFLLYLNKMIEILVIALCLIGNAFLSLSEMAFVTVKLSRLEYLKNKGSRPAAKLLKLRENPERTLSVIQIGITLVGALAAAVGGAGADKSISPWLESFGLNAWGSELVAIILVVAPITYLSVVVGELVPKSLAIRNSESISLATVRPLIFLEHLLSPVVNLFESSTKFVIRSLDIEEKPEEKHQDQQSIELESISPEIREAILRHSRLDKTSVKDLMTPWSQVIWLKNNMLAGEVREVLKMSGHTRLPVFDGEGVIGILHAKEFFSKIDSDTKNWKFLIRESTSIQMLTPVSHALGMLQRRKSHMAIVLHDDKLLGILTIEDIVSEIFGDFQESQSTQKLRHLISK